MLAIWGGFVPIGFALADFTAQAMLPSGDPQRYLLVAIAGFAILATIAAILLRAPGLVDDVAAGGAEGSFAATMTLPVALVALAFGIYVVLSVGFFTFMPAYVGTPGSSIVLSAGAIALFVPIGNVLAGLLVSGRDARFIALLSAAGFAINAALAIPAFGASSPTVATSALALFAIAGGMTASALFASIPFIVRRGGSASVAIGLVAQAGGIGTLFGPPLAGYVIETYGFAGFGWFLAAVAVGRIAASCRSPIPERREIPRRKRHDDRDGQSGCPARRDGMQAAPDRRGLARFQRLPLACRWRPHMRHFADTLHQQLPSPGRVLLWAGPRSIRCRRSAMRTTASRNCASVSRSRSARSRSASPIRPST